MDPAQLTTVSGETVVQVLREPGGSTESVPGRPGVIAARTSPRDNARGVSVSAFPALDFTEPVKGIGPASVRLVPVGCAPPPAGSTGSGCTDTGASEDSPGDPVPLRIVGLKPGLEHESVELTGTEVPPPYVVSLTLFPLVSLSFGTKYRLELTDAITDEDGELLVPYVSRFSTFLPEEVGKSNEADPPTVTGLVILGERGYVLETLHAGGVAGPQQSSVLRVYNVTDPVQPEDMTELREIIAYPPRDIAGEEVLADDGSPTGEKLIAIATAPRTFYQVQGSDPYWTELKSTPANLFLYDVSDPDAKPRFAGAANITNNIVDGIPNRLFMQKDRIYAATYPKGIQVIAIANLRTGFETEPTGQDLFELNKKLFAGGLNPGAIVLTIPVKDPTNGLTMPLNDLEAMDLQVWGVPRKVVAATGSRPQAGLVLADGVSPYFETGDSQPRPLWLGPLAKDGSSLEWGGAIALTKINDIPHALVGGTGVIAGAGSQTLLAIVDLSPVAPAVPTGEPKPSPKVVAIVPLPRLNGVGDILLIGNTAVVSGAQGTRIDGEAGGAALVDFTDPESPEVVGHVAGIASRIAVDENNILFSGHKSFIKGTDPEPGGVKTAALGNVALVEGTNPARIVVGEGPRAAEKFDVLLRVIPRDIEVRSAKLEYRILDVTHSSQDVVLSNGRGQHSLPQGFTFPRVANQLSRVRLVVNPGDPDELVSRPRAWTTSKVDVRFRWDEEPEVVTADRPELEVEATSDEWYRRAQEASAAAPAENRTITWEAHSPPAGTLDIQTRADDGIFETVLQTGTKAGETRYVTAKLGDIVLGTTELLTVEPGLAEQLTLTSDRDSFPADERTEVLLTLQAKDGFGNPVADGTAVHWDTNGEGEFVAVDEVTQNGAATARYRAGSYRPESPTIKAFIDEQVAEKMLRQEYMELRLTPSKEAISIFDTGGLELEVEVSSPAGPPANGATLEWWSTSGKVEVTQPLTNGIARARWIPVRGMLYRPIIAYAVSIGSQRGSARVDWVPRRTVDVQREEAVRTVDMGATEIPGGGVLMQEVLPDPAVATVEPMVIAGDRTDDGVFLMELPDGTFKELPYRATAEYRLTGLIPGERVDLRLGSNKNPNVLPQAYYRAEQDISLGVVADERGQHDGTATPGVSVVGEGYLGRGFEFDGQGEITVPHDPDFEFTGAFMVQAAVKPPPDSGQTILEKPGQYQLALVPDGAELKARFTVTTASGEASVTSVLSVPAESWSLITGRYEAGRLTVGIGHSEDWTLISEQPLHGSADLALGPGYSGLMDEIRIVDLSQAPLSTFANGQQELSFVADGSGEFSTTILSTGQLSPPTTQVASLSAEWMEALLLQTAEDEPDISQVALGGYFTDTVAFFRDRGEQSESTVGYVASELLAYGFEFVAGIWGAGDGNPTSLAGDLVGGTVLGIISTPKDFINAAERAVRLQGNKWDAVTIVTALVGAASIVASKKAKVVGNVGKLAKLIGRGDNSGPLGRRLAKEVVQKLDDVPGTASLDNLARIAAEGSDEARLALKNLMDGVGSRGGRLDLVEGVLANSDDAEGMIKAMSRIQNRLPQGELADILTLAGTCAVRAASRGPVRVASLSAMLMVAAAAVAGACPNWTPKALEGLADFTEIVRTTQAARGKVAKGMQSQLMQHLAARGKITEVLEKVNHFATQSPRPDGFADVLLDLGRKQSGTSRGAERVLEMGYALVNPPVAGRTLKRFELPTDIPALPTKRGFRSRRYDLVLDEAVPPPFRQVNVEVKAWEFFPPFTQGQLNGALDQMRRDFVLQVTSVPPDLSRIRWLFPDIPEAARPQLMSYFRNSLEHSAPLKAALGAQGFTPKQIDDFVTQYKGLIDRGRLIQFVP